MPKARSIVIAIGVTALVNVIVNVAARSGFPLRLGASAAESRIPLPGDELFPDAQCQYDRARTIAAPSSTVWPWIAQLGQNKAGFYSFEMLEILFGCDIHGDDRIHPEWQSVAPGDPFALHPEMGLRVAEVTPERLLLLTSQGGRAPEGPEFHATWAIVLSPVELRSGGTGTRVHLRERYQAPTETGLAMIKALSVVSALMSWRMLSRLAVLTTRSPTRGCGMRSPDRDVGPPTYLGARASEPARECTMGGMTVRPPSPSILVWSLAISLLVVVASVAGLADPRVYAQETKNWAMQAKGQDLGNLLAVVILCVAAVHYRKGSHRAGLVWLGTLLYLIYAFVVYAMAVHLNYLFLVYVAALGLSAWAVIQHVDHMRCAELRYPQGRPRTVAAWVIISVGILFTALWLGELVPALLAGRVPPSLTEAGLWVNPIHVIDLSVVLPGFIVAGVAALRGREHGLFWLAPWLVFSALMGSSIVAAMALMMMTGDLTAVPATIMVTTVVVASLLAVSGYLRQHGLSARPVV